MSDSTVVSHIREIRDAEAAAAKALKDAEKKRTEVLVSTREEIATKKNEELNNLQEKEAARIAQKQSDLDGIKTELLGDAERAVEALRQSAVKHHKDAVADVVKHITSQA